MDLKEVKEIIVEGIKIHDGLSVDNFVIHSFNKDEVCFSYDTKSGKSKVKNKISYTGDTAFKYYSCFDNTKQ